MQKKIDLIKSIYVDSLSFQYNSAASMYFLQGTKHPDKFGSNCYQQAKRLKEKLIKAGIDTYYIEDMTIGRHRSLLSFIGEDIYYLNPYFMHKEPIKLDLNLKNRTINSFPSVSGNQSIIDFDLNEKGYLTVIKNWPHQKRKDSFKFDINKCLSSEITYKDYFWRSLHPEQNSLSIRFLDTFNQSVNHLICYLNGSTETEFLIRTNDGEKIFEHKSKEFNTELEKLVEIISSNKNETIDFLQGALEIHKKLSKKQIKQPIKLQT